VLLRWRLRFSKDWVDGKDLKREIQDGVGRSAWVSVFMMRRVTKRRRGDR